MQEQQLIEILPDRKKKKAKERISWKGREIEKERKNVK